MAKDSNIVHQYFRKEFDDLTLLVKLNPLAFRGLEITVPKKGEPSLRELEFDEHILEDLKADGFAETGPLEFNLYFSGLMG